MKIKNRLLPYPEFELGRNQIATPENYGSCAGRMRPAVIS